MNHIPHLPRAHQARLQHKASRKAVSKRTTTGIISWIRHYNRIVLALTLASLVFSVLLLFIGTYVYFDASIVGDATLQARTPTYDAILRMYGINETDFSVLFPATPTPVSNFKLINYQIGISMMFVGAISILLEVGLVCAILFEHFKCSVLYSVIMTGALVHGLCTGGQLYAASITFQVAFLAAFVFFALGIKVKKYAADRIIECGSDIELRHCLNGSAGGGDNSKP